MRLAVAVRIRLLAAGVVCVALAGAVGLAADLVGRSVALLLALALALGSVLAGPQNGASICLLPQKQY